MISIDSFKKGVELVGESVVVAALDPESETFVGHVTSLSAIALPSSFPLDVHPSQIEQHLILRPRLPTVYAVGRYLRLWKLSVLRPLVKEMRSSFLERHWMTWRVSSRLDATGFALQLCVDVSLV